jgi:hypothetical protein
MSDEPPLDLHGMVYGPNGRDRLCLLYEPRREHGWDFHSIRWEEQDREDWKPRITITQEQFQADHDRRRWVSEVYSLDPQRGWCVLKVAEGDKPDGAFSIRFHYSWRTWDLLNNREIGKLKDCQSPHDPL